MVILFFNFLISFQWTKHINIDSFPFLFLFNSIPSQFQFYLNSIPRTKRGNIVDQYKAKYRKNNEVECRQAGVQVGSASGWSLHWRKIYVHMESPKCWQKLFFSTSIRFPKKAKRGICKPKSSKKRLKSCSFLATSLLKLSMINDLYIYGLRYYWIWYIYIYV